MESASVIEDVRDYVKRKNHGDMALCLLLEKFWPRPDGEPAEMSGMICFVVLFRFIFCRLAPRDCLDGMIGQTALLRFAMSNFGGAKAEEERQACRLMRDTLTEQLRGQPTFAKLAESEMLLKSIWSYDPFKLFYPILWRFDPDSEWTCLPAEVRDLVDAKKSLIVWNTAKHVSITEAIGASEGRFEGRLEGAGEDEVEFTLAFRAPLVMRVKVLFGDKIERFDISHISEIELQEIRAITKRIGTGKDTAEITDITFRKGPGAYMYRLLAIIRLRATGSEQDYARFYDSWGDLVVPNTKRPGMESIFSNQWSIQDQSHSLMLYYMRLGIEASQSYGKITDELGVEKSQVRSADTPGPGTYAPATLPLSGGPGALIEAAVEESAAAGAGPSGGPTRPPGATSKLDIDQVMECIGSTQISLPSQDNKAPQASQVRTSATGRGKPAESAQPARDAHGGRGGHAGRGATAAPPTSSVVLQRKRRIDTGPSDSESKRLARKADMETKDPSSQDKGYASLGDEQVYEQPVKKNYVPHETVEATNQGSGSNPMRRLDLFVRNPDVKFMAELWVTFDRALDYPSSAGFTCSGKPWEVKVHGDHAELFFGQQGCLKSKIIGHISSMTKAKIYARWEDEFIHIGLTTQMNAEWTQKGHDGELLMFLMSASGAFRFLADWARKVKAGEHICFTEFMENHAQAVANGTGTQGETI